MSFDTNRPTISPGDTSEPLDVLLLSRYLADESTPDEQLQVQSWLNEDPARKGILEALRAETVEADPNLDLRTSPEDAWKAFERTRLNANGDRRNARRIPGTIPQKHRYPRFTKFVFGAIGAVAIALGIVQFVTHTPSSTTFTEQRTYTTKAGQQLTISLGDGSQVILAPNTQIAIDKRFGRDSRTVSLLGEAYFSVAASPDAPFLVRTGEVETRVLGTEFNIRGYEGDDTISVAVVTGKVETGRTGSRLTLSAGHYGVITDSSATSRMTPDLSALTGWTQGNLAFDNEPLPSVLRRLGHWYGYEFKLADPSLANARLSVVFRTDSPNEALRILQEMLNVSVAIKDSVVTLTARKGSAHSLDSQSKQPKRVAPARMEMGK